MMPYERFDAWKVCHELVLAVYKTTESWPDDAGDGVKDGVKAHICRSAILAPAKLANGSARRSRTAFRKFILITLGYISELAYLLQLALDLELLSKEDWQKLDNIRGRASFYTWKLFLEQAPAPGPDQALGE